jgi:multisubunit Na+/H+ antiporter MnhB subunit
MYPFNRHTDIKFFYVVIVGHVLGKSPNVHLNGFRVMAVSFSLLFITFRWFGLRKGALPQNDTESQREELLELKWDVLELLNAWMLGIS